MTVVGIDADTHQSRRWRDGGLDRQGKAKRPRKAASLRSLRRDATTGALPAG